MPNKQVVDLCSEGDFEGKIKIQVAGKIHEIVVENGVLTVDGGMALDISDTL